MSAAKDAAAAIDGAALRGPAGVRAAIGEIERCAAACRAQGATLRPALDLVRRSRLGAVRVPAAAGGGGCSVREYFAMLVDLAEADADVAHILRAHFWFVEDLLRGADDAQHARWIERVVAGDIFGIAATELGGKESVGTWAFRTSIVPDGAGYRLNGTKYYCTGSLYCDWVMVWGCDPAGALVSAIVPVDRDGVVLEDDWDGIGQRLTASGTGRFVDVAVHADEILSVPLESPAGGAPVDPSGPYLTGQFCQLILTAVIAGILRTVQADALGLVQGRRRTYSHATGETPDVDPLLQQVIGEIAATAFAAEALILAAAEAQDAALASVRDGVADPELAHLGSLRAAQAKVVVDDLAVRAATALFDVGGASAITARADLDRHWRNIRTIASHNPTVYKARSVGNFLATGEPLPTNGF